MVNKKNILKIVLISIVILIVILAIYITRKYLIITDLQNKISKYTNSNNFYVKVVSTYEKDDSIVITESYKKDNKGLIIVNRK